jgi:hypothetical protein
VGKGARYIDLLYYQSRLCFQFLAKEDRPQLPLCCSRRPTNTSELGDSSPSRQRRVALKHIDVASIAKNKTGSVKAMQSTKHLFSARAAAPLMSPRGSRLLWKAYAIALQAYLTTQDDLCHSGKAIFIASPGLYDIPGGSYAPQEVTNEMVFRRADVVQDGRTPFFSSDGESYFSFCRK